MVNPHLFIVTLWSTFSVSAAQLLQYSDLKRWTILNCSNTWYTERTRTIHSLPSLSEAAINLTSLVLPGQTFWLQLSGSLHSTNCPLYSNVLYKVTSSWQYKLIEVEDETDENFKKKTKRILSVGYVYDSILHNGRNKSVSCYHERHLIQLKGNNDYGFASCIQNKSAVLSARDEWARKVPFPYSWAMLTSVGSTSLLIIVVIIISCTLKSHSRGRFYVHKL